MIVDTRWRAGDTLPIALDGSPRQPHAMPVSRIVRDPELIGYASNGKEGYGGEMLFGKGAHSIDSNLNLRWIPARKARGRNLFESGCLISDLRSKFSSLNAASVTLF